MAQILFWIFLLAPGAAVEPPPESINIVVVIADAWRYSAFSGAEKPDSLAVTPRLDAFRGEAVDFSRAYSAYPLCTPSRISIQSGLYPSHHNVTKNGAPLALGTPTMASTLSGLGFNTAFFGKWHVGGDGYGSSMAMKMVSEPHRHGFKYWEQGVSQPGSGFGDYRHPVLLSPAGSHQPVAGTWEPEFYTDRAIAWLRKQPQSSPPSGGRPSAPFFLMLSWRPPHGPWGFEPKEGSQKVMSLYTKQLAEGSDKLKLRPNMPKRRWERPQDKDGLLSMMKGYYAAVMELDKQFGRVLDSVDALPPKVRDVTAVVFCSDHGEMLESHELIGKGHWYDESARVPLMLRLPPALLAREGSSSSSISSSGSSGRVYRHAASLTDLYPTLVSLATRGGLLPRDQSSSSTPTTSAYLEARSHIVAVEPVPAESSGGGGGGGGGVRISTLEGTRVDGLDLAADVLACARGSGVDLLLACGGSGLGEEEGEEYSGRAVEFAEAGGDADDQNSRRNPHNNGNGGGRGGSGSGRGKKSGGNNLGAYKWSKRESHARRHGRGLLSESSLFAPPPNLPPGVMQRGAAPSIGVGDSPLPLAAAVRTPPHPPLFPVNATSGTFRRDSLHGLLNDKHGEGLNNQSAVVWPRLPQEQWPDSGQGRHRRPRRHRRLKAHRAGRGLSRARVVFSGMPGFWRMATTGAVKVVVTGKACDCGAERLYVDLEADPFEMRVRKSTSLSAGAGVAAAGSWYGEEVQRVEASLFAWCRTNRAETHSQHTLAGWCGSSSSGTGSGLGGGKPSLGFQNNSSSSDSDHVAKSSGSRHRKPSKLGAGIVKGEKAVVWGLPEGTKGRTGRKPATGATVVFESTDNRAEAEARHTNLKAASAHHHHLRNKDERGGRDQTEKRRASPRSKPAQSEEAAQEPGPQTPWWKKKLEKKKAGS